MPFTQMSCAVAYGVGSTLRLELPSSSLLADADVPRGEPLSDPAAAVFAALEEPLNYPPLAKATVPRDRIALVLDRGLPQAEVIVAAVVRYLVEAGATAENITLLRTRSDAAADDSDPRRTIPDAWRSQVQLQLHDPRDREQLGLLCASPGKRPVYLNRTLLDADVVVPIGCLRCEPAPGYYHAAHGGVFPTFSSEKTVERFRKPRGAVVCEEVAGKQRDEIDEAGWLLGVQFTLQVVPAGGDGVLSVWAGEPQDVFRRGQERCRAAWCYDVPGRASLVVAALTGPAEQQTWENLALALAHAQRAVADGGAIALCTSLGLGPGPAVASLVDCNDLDAAWHRIRHDCPPDAQVAHQLTQALSRVQLYLLSQLDEALVEDLGISWVAAPQEIGRLAQRHPTCTVMAHAQHAVATAEGE